MRKFILFLMVIALCFTVEAQRPGSGSTRGGGSVSRSTSVSHQSPSRGSSVSHTSSSRTYTPSRSSSVSHSQSRSSSSVTRSSTSPSRGYDISTQRPSRTPSNARTTQQRDSRPSNTPNSPVTRHMGRNDGPTQQPGHHPGHHPGQPPQVPHGMHPHPPMHHPVHHGHIHMHYTPVTCWLMHDYYWHGYWTYAHTYPYEDVVIYVSGNNRNTELIALVCDELYVYSIYYDRWENRKYFTITDNTDKMFVKTEINRKYMTLLIGDGGVWLFKKNDRDPLFFSYQNGTLYKYEQD